MFLVLAIMWKWHATTSWKSIQSYLQYKPSTYGKCDKGADVDEEDDNQIGNPGHPTLGSVLMREKSVNLYLFFHVWHLLGFKMSNGVKLKYKRSKKNNNNNNWYKLNYLTMLFLYLGCNLWWSRLSDISGINGPLQCDLAVSFCLLPIQ